MEATEKFVRIWKECDGWYVCPQDAIGNRTGKLVGYAGKYKAADGNQKQFVGDIYANFAMVDRFPRQTHAFAAYVLGLLHTYNAKTGMINMQRIEWTLGAPMGGIKMAEAIATSLGCQSLFAEKKITQLETATSREISKLTMKRYSIPPNTMGLIGEDVTNNYSSTEQLLDLAKAVDSRVVGIMTALNRSPVEMYVSPKHGEIPVFSTIFMPMPEYRQDDPSVADDIERGNVAFDPKAEWDNLLHLMEVGSHLTLDAVV